MLEVVGVPREAVADGDQSTPSWRPTFSSPTFQSPLLTNCSTATCQPRATPRTITPNAAELLPLPLPVLTTTSDGRPGAAVGAGILGRRLSVIVAGVYARGLRAAIVPRRSQDPAKSGENPALTRNGDASRRRWAGDESGRLALRATTRPSRQGRFAATLPSFLSSNSWRNHAQAPCWPASLAGLHWSLAACGGDDDDAVGERRTAGDVGRHDGSATATRRADRRRRR